MRCYAGSFAHKKQPALMHRLLLPYSGKMYHFTVTVTAFFIASATPHTPFTLAAIATL